MGSAVRKQYACDQDTKREQHAREWGQSAVITTQVVDLTDASQFPEMALARQHLARLREQEARLAAMGGRNDA